MSKTEFLLKDNLGPHYVYHESRHQCRCCQTRLFAPLLGLPLISGLTAVVALMGPTLLHYRVEAVSNDVRPDPPLAPHAVTEFTQNITIFLLYCFEL